MLKQKGQESSSPSGTKPYGRTLRSTAKVNYIDADSQVLPDSVRVVDHRVIVEASKGCITGLVPLCLVDADLMQSIYLWYPNSLCCTRQCTQATRSEQYLDC
jgi:hypothetical protein